MNLYRLLDDFLNVDHKVESHFPPLSKNNKHRPRLVAGFSAETENLTKNSINKMKKKHCDFIFANDVSQKDIGFNSDYNKITVIDKKGVVKIIPKNKKMYPDKFVIYLTCFTQ